jgi:hypothetical protein
MRGSRRNPFPFQKSGISRGKKVESELGVLGAVGMREPRSDVRISGGLLHMRLRAFCCPPARDISLRIAHLHAAGSPMRFRTMAVAPACGNTPQQCGCVREERERAAQENDSREKEPTEGTSPRERFAEESAHGGILRVAWEKTDSPGSPGVLLLGSWN